MQTRREEPGMAKQTNQASHRANTPTHTHTQPRQKQTRWKSVRTKPRQADTTNQANSNDFPAPLPYKGKGTPSVQFSCCCLGIFWPRIPCGALLVRCGQLPRSCYPALLSVASRSHWRGLQRSFRALTGWREGAQWLQTAPFQHSHRQRKWLHIPDGRHNQKNSSKELCFSTSVWNSTQLPCHLLPPASFFPSQTLPLSPSSNSKQ